MKFRFEGCHRLHYQGLILTIVAVEGHNTLRNPAMNLIVEGDKA